MSVQWKKLLVKTIVWLAAEIFLNLSGLDSLADYGEFMGAIAMSSETLTSSRRPPPSSNLGQARK